MKSLPTRFIRQPRDVHAPPYALVLTLALTLTQGKKRKKEKRSLNEILSQSKCFLAVSRKAEEIGKEGSMEGPRAQQILSRDAEYIVPRTIGFPRLNKSTGAGTSTAKYHTIPIRAIHQNRDFVLVLFVLSYHVISGMVSTTDPQECVCTLLDLSWKTDANAGGVAEPSNSTETCWCRVVFLPTARTTEPCRN